MYLCMWGKVYGIDVQKDGFTLLVSSQFETDSAMVLYILYYSVHNN